MTSKVKGRIFRVSGVIVAIGLLGFGGYRYFELWIGKNLYEKKAAGFERSLQIAQTNISVVEKENLELNEALEAERSKNGMFENQIRQISGAVGVLEKWSATDPELLRKYSKVYFLSDNYFPSKLTEIDPAYIYNKKKPQQFHESAWPFFKRLLDAADRDGVKLQVISAYRSFGDQTAIKSAYKMVYGAGTANQFSADQGYSEHQLGTAADLHAAELKEPFVKFEKSPAYKWLLENAHRYGFTLSYPENNSYYQFEPWHWRFVGTTLAGKLHEENKHFYELTQREINQFLVTIFD
jgi:LAS superfamily LD-carboxypeptidase LdcB